MLHWIEQHQLIAGVGLYYLYSNAVQALPVPTETSNGAYRWFFAFSHGLAGNIKYAMQKALPQYVAPEQKPVMQ